MKGVRALLCAWPWVVVIGVACWLGSPLWQAQDVVYGRIAGDGLATPWLYDWVARTLLAGGELGTVGDFGFGNDFQRYRDFPSAMDAVIAAPTSWFMDWPQQYSGAQALALVVNGLGVAALAWAMGCRGFGLALAGVLGACLEPVWKELWYARMNAAWPGVAAAALASWLVLIRPRDTGEGWWRTLFAAVLALGLGVLAAGVYPPTLVMLTLPALACWIATVRQSPSQSVLGLVVVGAALCIAWPLLTLMLHSQRAWTFHCPAGSWVGFCRDGTIGIPPSLGGGVTMFDVGPELNRWLGVLPNPGQSGRQIALGAWLLSGLCLLSDKRRRVLAAWLGLGGFLALLGQGPCPADANGLPSGLAMRTPGLGSALNWTWCNTSALHDFGRYTTAALVLASVCSGLGIQAIGERWKRGGKVLGALLALLAMGQCIVFSSGRLLRADRWETVPTLESSPLIATLEPGPIAELPFDSHAQLISVLEVPGLQRVNPFGGVEHGPDNWPFIQWLYGLGRGEIPATTPNKAMIAGSSVRWVLFDPARCIPPFTGREQACREEIASTLNWVLGDPVLTSGNIRIWKVE